MANTPDFESGSLGSNPSPSSENIRQSSSDGRAIGC